MTPAAATPAAQPTPAAEAANDGAGSSNGEITVTARKRNETVRDIPAAISAFSAETLTARGVGSVKAIDQVVPSVHIENVGAGNISQAAVFIRGVGNREHLIFTDPGVGVYLDGVYLGRAMGANLSLSNIDHIEVLRGPQGTLSGRNTLGGAINVVTKLPGQQEAFEMSATLGTRERANASFYGSTPITDTLAFSLSGLYEHRGGVGKFVNLPEANVEVGQIDQGSGRAVLAWTPSTETSVILSADGMKGNYGISPIQNTIINPNGFFGLKQSDFPANAYDSGTTNAKIPNTNAKNFGTSLTVRQNLNANLSIKAIGSYRYLSYKGGLDDDNSPYSYSEYPEYGHSRQSTGELQLNGEYDKLNFVTGAYYFHENGVVRQNFIYNNVPGQAYGGQETNSYALYAHAGYNLTESLKLSGGVRYTWDKKDAFILARTVQRSENWNAPTWDVALDYKISPSLAAYATIQRGYQSGGFPARANSAAVFVPYDPTYATNHEVGLKGRLGNVLQFAADVFYTQYKDLVVSQSTSTPTGFITLSANAARSRTYGAEFEGTLFLGKYLSLDATVGYNNAKYTRLDAGVTSVVAGTRPLGSPLWTVAIGPQFKTTLASGDTLTARVDTNYRSSVFNQPVNGVPNIIPRRYLTNFEISYGMPDKGLTFSIYGTNIFNEKYVVGQLVLNTAGFKESILNNDRSEFGVRIKKKF
ncbi:TonB-dependent receptor [Sphingomonas sp.]|uniref:TonB-dependent receptor n=1 Tax=Sphingomonas sp. TaxID=28214 RepID=UPI0025CBDBDB|nr:TonB-dependent receptor [Sphingomonas sp.]